jgi:hypothetical protein
VLAHALDPSGLGHAAHSLVGLGTPLSRNADNMCYRKVVDNLIILLVLKFDSHRSDSLGVMLFTNSVTESVQILYRFQKLYCLFNLMLQSVHGHYKKVVGAFLILLVLKFHN